MIGKLITTIFIIFVGVCVLYWSAIAAPFLICDPHTSATRYLISFGGGGTEESLAQADGSMRHDIGTWKGSISGTVHAGYEYILNGEPQGIWRYSDPVPFTLECPSVSTPTGLSLSQ